MSSICNLCHIYQKTLFLCRATTTSVKCCIVYIMDGARRIGALEREWFHTAFKQGEIKLLVASKVASFATGLPGASVAIQVSGTYDSRQEEAQRLGRVLRPKVGKAFDQVGLPHLLHQLLTCDWRPEQRGDNNKVDDPNDHLLHHQPHVSHVRLGSPPGVLDLKAIVNQIERR